MPLVYVGSYARNYQVVDAIYADAKTSSDVSTIKADNPSIYIFSFNPQPVTIDVRGP